MTIICVRDGIMAADTGESIAGLMIVTNRRKIQRIGTALFACSGDATVIEEFLLWRSKAGKEPVIDDKDQLDALQLDSFGLHRWDWKLRRMTLLDPYFAIGGNWEFATGLMCAGYTAEQAVRETIKYSIYAGGEVQVERLDDRPS